MILPDVKKILLVDGKKSALEEEKRFLDGRGLMVLTAPSAEEALSVHEREKVDLIVADLDLPGMSGDKLCSMIRNNASLKNVSFIIICGGSKSEMERCTGCGANAYIAKPVDPALFVEKLSALADVPKRSAIRVLLKVSVKGKHKDHGFFCTSINVSTSGILLETDKVISKGDIINCSFFVPGSQIISADCEVKRLTQTAPEVYQYGARFLNLGADSEKAIDELVRRTTNQAGKGPVTAGSGRKRT